MSDDGFYVKVIEQALGLNLDNQDVQIYKFNKQILENLLLQINKNSSSDIITPCNNINPDIFWYNLENGEDLRCKENKTENIKLINGSFETKYPFYFDVHVKKVKKNDNYKIIKNLYVEDLTHLYPFFLEIIIQIYARHKLLTFKDIIIPEIFEYNIFHNNKKKHKNICLTIEMEYIDLNPVKKLLYLQLNDVKENLKVVHDQEYVKALLGMISNKKQELKEILELFKAALGYLNSFHIYHNDVNYGNIGYTIDKKVCILDFGSATLFKPGNTAPTVLYKSITDIYDFKTWLEFPYLSEKYDSNPSAKYWRQLENNPKKTEIDAYSKKNHGESYGGKTKFRKKNRKTKRKNKKRTMKNKMKNKIK